MKGIITKYNENCMFCGKPTRTQHHFLFGYSVRQFAEEDGVKGPVCDDCHNMGELIKRIHGNIAAEKLSKMVGQLAWEKHAVANGMTEDEAREAFRKRYKRSYL